GWRLGAFAFPESLAWLHRTMAAVASETYTTVSAPIQYAAIAGFDASAEMDDYLARARRVLKPLAWHAYYRLVAAGARVVEPEGGFYLMANFDSQRDALARRGIRNGTAFCEALLEQTGVAALPGVQFGRPASELSLRVALVDFDGEAAQAAADGDAVIDETFLRARCGHVMEAVDRIADWVGAAGVRAGVQAGGRRAQSM
ncbi:MAG: aminotransferase class I/II-fold pyridoxal phosphate-dependent enzyme, partial [Gammaproteobacteria bacterium]